MPYKDPEVRKKAIRNSMRKLRGMVEIGDVNPEDVNPWDMECEPLDVNPCEPQKVFPNYDIHPKHQRGCKCILCSPADWPDLKVKFDIAGPVGYDPDRKWFPNYNIHPAHSNNCDCLCCLGGVNGKDGKFKLMKDLLAGV